MVRPLARAGIMVLETGSAKEADKLVAQHSPCAVIVDVRLRDADGISWLRSLRSQGLEMPAVILSENWSDRPRLQSLRQSLNVSLVLQKPIVSEIFLQQMQAVIPGCAELLAQYSEDKRSASVDKTSSTKIKTSGKATKQAKPGTKKATQESDTVDEPEPLEDDADPSETDLMRAINDTMHRHQEQQAARSVYAQALPLRAAELLQSLQRCAQQPNNGIVMNEAVQFAHRMRSTSVSFAMLALSEAAGRIEDLLLGLRDIDDDAYQIIWTQITRSMDEIKTLSALASGSPSALNDVAYLSRKIILLGDATRFAKESAELAQAGVADTIILDSVESAQRRLRAGNVDGIVIDFGLEHSDEILSFIFNTRLQYVEAPPVALLGAHARALQHYERLYLGSSLTLNGESDPLDTYAKSLIALTNSRKQRVLTVMDDPASIQTVDTVLGSAGLNAKNLKDVARIFRELEQFKPDALIISEKLRGASGYDVCRVLRASDAYKQIPLLLLASHTGRAAANAAFTVGANDIINMPIVSEQLLSRVREQLQLKRLQEIGREIGDDGLYTRRAMMAKIEQMCKSRGTFSLAMIAIKKFEVIGLRHGIRAQDATTDLACALLRSRFRFQDLRARWSESTLMVVFPGESIDVAGSAVSLLCDEFARCELYSPGGNTFKPSLSFGLAMKEPGQHDVDKLLDSAYKHLNAATFA
jgi:PleD family two-component response regulator